MKQLKCSFRVECLAARITSEADLDEWLCGVDLEGNVTIAKKADGTVIIKSRDLNLAFNYGDWLITNEDQYSTLAHEDFEKAFEIDG